MQPETIYIRHYNKSYTKSGPGRVHNNKPKPKKEYNPTFSEIIRIHITNKQKEKIDALRGHP